MTEADEAPDAYSHLEFLPKRETDGEFAYRATHITDAREQTIRAFLTEEKSSVFDATPRLKKSPMRGARMALGYQDVFQFDVVADFRRREVQVYHRADVADVLIRRLAVRDLLQVTNMRLSLDDVKRVERIPGVQHVHGVWKPKTGPVSSAGYFGPAVTEDPNVVMGPTKAVHLAYKDGDDVIDIYLSEDCRIGSRAKHLKGRDILRIYRVFEENLVFPSIANHPGRPVRPGQNWFGLERPPE